MQQSKSSPNRDPWIRYETVKAELLLLIILFICTGICPQFVFSDRLIMENSSTQVEILTCIMSSGIIYLMTRIILFFGSFLFGLRTFFGLVFISSLVFGFYCIITYFLNEFYTFTRVIIGDSWMEYFASRADYFTGEFYYLCRICALLFFWWLILLIVSAPFFFMLFILKWCFSKIFGLLGFKKFGNDNTNETKNDCQDSANSTISTAKHVDVDLPQISQINTSIPTLTSAHETQQSQSISQSTPISNHATQELQSNSGFIPITTEDPKSKSSRAKKPANTEGSESKGKKKSKKK